MVADTLSAFWFAKNPINNSEDVAGFMNGVPISGSDVVVDDALVSRIADGEKPDHSEIDSLKKKVPPPLLETETVFAPDDTHFFT
jgi:hypothetical protein